MLYKNFDVFFIKTIINSFLNRSNRRKEYECFEYYFFDNIKLR